jgi:Na+-driven multidrug efflux pump
VLIPLALVAVLLPLFFGLRGVLIALATLSIIAALVGGFVFFRRRKERVFSIP